MNAEELIARAAGRGIDLKAVAEAQTDTSRHADAPTTKTYQRCGLRIVTLQPPPGARAYGKQTRSMTEIEWGSDEVGLAIAGLPRAPTMAALYSYAGHTANYWPLVDELMAVVLPMRRRERWAFRVPSSRDGCTTSYLDTLCAMVLDEDRYPGVFDYAPEPQRGQESQRGIIRAAYCDVTLPVWRGSLAGKYEQVRAIYWGWLDEAARRVQAKLRRGDDED